MLIKITPGCNRILLLAGSLLLSFSVTLTQNEYVSILDYQNLAVNRLANIAAIAYVDADNSTYDANHQRFFFLAVGPGGSNTELYTIDVSSGAVLYHPATGRVAGLQYDNTSDTLYALSFDGGGKAHFSWIEPATGVVHGISDLPSFTGYQESGFDRKDHWYICNGGLSPSYQWQVNGIDQGADRDSLADFSLSDGDVVSCILTGSQTCSLPVGSANTIRMTVNPTPVLQMGNDTVIKPGQQVQLDPAISGTIGSYQWDPPTGLDNPGIPRAIATPVATTTYQLTVVSDKGCRASGKMTIVVYYPLQMPNAFTPNGDGRNDVFRIPPSNPQRIMNFAIFSRWGERVYETTDAGRGWDGTFHNQPQASGTYVWKIEYEDILTHKHAIASGVVVLIR